MLISDHENKSNVNDLSLVYVSIMRILLLENWNICATYCIL